MRILMLGWELPPHNSGGLGVACLQLCQALARKDIDIEFMLPYEAVHNAPFMAITAARPQGPQVILNSSSAYDSLNYISDGDNLEATDIYSQQRLYEQAVGHLATKTEYDVIHAHDWLTFRAALRAKQVRNVPLILHVHSVESDRAGGSGGNPLVREIEATSLLLADTIVAVSQHTKNAIIKDYAIPADKIEVIHNSIDHTTLDSLLAEDPENTYQYLTLLKARGYHIVSSIGRLTVQKGLVNLLHAARAVIDREPKTIFLIAGSGEQYFELIELSAALGIAKNVIFTGFQRGKYWRDSFTIADLFVMPSVSEPFGIAPLEAIGFGVPALVSRQSGVTEVMQNILTVDFWDVQTMADRITAVVQNAALRTELKTSAQRELAKMSWNHAADKLCGIYDQQMDKLLV